MDIAENDSLGRCSLLHSCAYSMSHSERAQSASLQEQAVAED